MTSHAPALDHTHNPAARSWVESANDPASHFPIQNLPFCAFSTANDQWHRTGVRIGDSIVDLYHLFDHGVFADLIASFGPDSVAAEMIDFGLEGDLSYLCALSPDQRRALRHAIFAILSADATGPAATLRDTADLRNSTLIPVADCTFHLPHTIHDYTDFYASIHHATTVGTMFRPDNPLLPNYKWIPIGYHGRASSIVPTTTPITRPNGQTMADGSAAPAFGPCKLLDYELEVGVFVAQGNDLGKPIPIANAHEHIFGFVLVNDWSARDLQKWEYQPLGPFLAKNFATTISPYVITAEAMEPFRATAMKRADGDPAPLPYLADSRDQALGAFNVTLEVAIQTAAMRDKNIAPHTISRGSFRDMYWTFAQILTHHASNGCNMQPGDLLASGTISGTAPDARGCLLELTWDGNDPATNKPRPRKPLQLPTGETRTFLMDGDRVILRGVCAKDGARTIGFGECEGTILPAPAV
jgi:fumarylacetoacetase